MSRGLIDKALAKLVDYSTTKRTNITPLVGSNYAGFDNSWYEVSGRTVHIHLGLQGLSIGSLNTVYNMPLGLRPYTMIYATGTSGNWNAPCEVLALANGNINVTPRTYGYCAVEIVYMI